VVASTTPNAQTLGALFAITVQIATISATVIALPPAVTATALLQATCPHTDPQGLAHPIVVALLSGLPNVPAAIAWHALPLLIALILVSPRVLRGGSATAPHLPPQLVPQFRVDALAMMTVAASTTLDAPPVALVSPALPAPNATILATGIATLTVIIATALHPATCQPMALAEDAPITMIALRNGLLNAQAGIVRLALTLAIVLMLAIPVARQANIATVLRAHLVPLLHLLVLLVV
jgi:hypothetical protein